MNRRNAIQHIAIMAGGLLALPSWARNGWSPNGLPAGKGLFPAPDQATLAQIVDAILPESGIPGAQSLGVPAFVETMLADCYEKTVQDLTGTALHTLDARAQAQHGMPFSALSLPRRQALLLAAEQDADAGLRDAYGLLKNLTIQGYTTSEYIQTTYLEYKMAPGHYYGCVPVKQ